MERRFTEMDTRRTVAPTVPRLPISPPTTAVNLSGNTPRGDQMIALLEDVKYLKLTPPV